MKQGLDEAASDGGVEDAGQVLGAEQVLIVHDDPVEVGFESGVRRGGPKGGGTRGVKVGEGEGLHSRLVHKVEVLGIVWLM